jgi:CheY-like chemotaxis protein
MNDAPVLIINDDTDDQEFLKDAWNDLGFPNELVFFNNGEDVLNYLRTKKISPFLILCDVNLPKMDGFRLKQSIFEDAELNHLSIPFVFWSDEVSKAQIQKSYDLGGNGFFVKGDTFEAIKQSLVEIVQYWKRSKTPF